MKRRIIHFALLVLTGYSGSAWSQIVCTLDVTDVSIAVNTTQSNSDASANITVRCNRPGNQTSFPAQETYTVGIGQGLANRNLTRAGTPSTLLPYQIYKDSGYNNPWTIGSPSAAFSTNFPSGNSRNFEITLPYYFRIPTPTIATAGSYSDTIAVTLNVSPGGLFKAAAALAPTATLAAGCNMSSSIAPLVLNYTSFSPSVVSNSTPFSVTCTNTTPYTLSLSKTSGVLAGLSYTLAMNGAGATGNGLAQNYSVIGTIAAGQAGTCATGTCTATDPGLQITVAY